MSNTVKYILFTALAVVLIWATIYFGIINPTKLWADVSQANFWWVGVMVVLTFVAHGARAARWQILLEPMGYKPSFFNTNNAVWLGYFFNNLVPRLGEVTRCSSLWKTDDIPIEKSVGTVVTERIFDVLILFLLLGLNLLLDFDRLWAFISGAINGGESAQKSSSNLLFIIAGIAILGLGVLFVFRNKILQIPLVQKLLTIGKGLLDGLLSISKLRQPTLFIFYTVLIWAMYWLMGYSLFMAIPKFASLSPLVALTVLTSGALAMIVPTPGGVGAYNVIVALALSSIYGMAKEDSGTLASFIQSSQMICTLIIGAVFFLVSVLIKKSKNEQP
jgi:glycosyltransferase 2 family protein